jgi:hypothetical protein
MPFVKAADAALAVSVSVAADVIAMAVARHCSASYNAYDTIQADANPFDLYER